MTHYRTIMQSGGTGEIGEGKGSFLTHLIDVYNNNFVGMCEIDLMRIGDTRGNLFYDCVSFERIVISYCGSDGILDKRQQRRL